MFIMYLIIYVGVAFDFDASQDLSLNPIKQIVLPATEGQTTQ